MNNKLFFAIGLAATLLQAPVTVSAQSSGTSQQNPLLMKSNLPFGAPDFGSPDKPGGLSIQLCKSEKKEFYIRYSS